MSFQWISKELNIFSKCKQYRLSLWQCPQFLFLIMGLMIIATSLVTYTLGTRYFILDPANVSLIVFIMTIVLFVITFSIVRSMDDLAEASRLKSEFISIVSHQLRSPLSNMKWALDALIDERLGSLDPKQEEYIKIAQENSVRMGELVTDLLMTARIEQGQLPLDRTKFPLQDLIQEVINELKLLAGASNIIIKFEQSDLLPQVSADAQLLKVVVENLLDKGGGEVSVKIKNTDNDLLLEIKDNGVGIPKDDQKHIFQKFFRSRNVLKYQTQGSGLGLYIIKSILKRLGGRIWFQSKEGEGTTFWFTIPINK